MAAKEIKFSEGSTAFNIEGCENTVDLIGDLMRKAIQNFLK
ncbi:unnamed protein product [marine sediment metagenome]|uniref:Uncharacterized protein n=1 Tax=marine sediment metagenome TaxID=412755 RepID=X1K893_9ZZZZ